MTGGNVERRESGLERQRARAAETRAEDLQRHGATAVAFSVGWRGIGAAVRCLPAWVFARLRGIAARQFQRTFVLAEGIEILGAELKDGLLSIDLARPEPAKVVKTIEIASRG
jgi:hypothetical protein